jgi:predicted DNA-binding transcriptional regulator AlpA
MPSKPAPDRFLSFAEVAAMIGLEVETLKKGKAGTRDIPRIKLGSRVVFSLNSVQAWMARQAKRAERDKLKSQMAVIDITVERRRRRRAIQDTVKTLANGGKYKL